MTPSRFPAKTSSPDNRSRLLDLAADLYASKGYTQVSVRDLSSRLGLTTGAIYSNFRSKGELFAEILDVRITEDLEGTRPEMALPEFVRQNFLRLRTRATMRALLVDAATAARTDDELRSRLEPTLRALLDSWITEYRDWQTIRHVDSRMDMDALVRSLWSIELGFGVLDAHGALKVKPSKVAQFVSSYLASLELTERPRSSRTAPQSGSRKRQGADADLPAAGERTLTPMSALRDSPRAVATQSRLIETAIELFATRGYAAVTVRDLARATSMTTGSIYGNFTNKATLLLEVIEARIAEDLERIPPRLVETGSPPELVEYNVRAFEDRKRLRALLLEGAVAARSDPDVRNRLAQIHRRHLAVWSGGLDDWAASHGVVPGVDARTAVSVVWSGELGLGLLEAFGLATPPADDLARIYAMMFSVAGLDHNAVPASAPSASATLANG
jgi:AcrR family transcriptional regulator